jgi:hypothetical protein
MPPPVPIAMGHIYEGIFGDDHAYQAISTYDAPRRLLVDDRPNDECR